MKGKGKTDKLQASNSKSNNRVAWTNSFVRAHATQLARINKPALEQSEGFIHATLEQIQNQFLKGLGIENWNLFGIWDLRFGNCFEEHGGKNANIAEI